MDAADYEFARQWKWFAMRDRKTLRFYAARAVPIPGGKQKRLFLHRAIMNPPEEMCVDHIDRNPLNNCRSNPRLCTNAQNQRNVGLSKRNTSGFKGVSRGGKHGRHWDVSINLNGVRVYKKTFLHKCDAAQVYALMAYVHHGEFASIA